MNIIDYLEWRGDLSFKSSPFNEVDNLIFSMLSFIDYSGIVSSQLLGTPVKLSECLYRYDRLHPKGESFGVIIPQITGDLFRLAAESRRFSEIYATYYRNEISEEEQMQFSAITFILPDNSKFIAFRGTDDTLVGWREDFNLSFTCPVPSQVTAAEYVANVASVYSGKIRMGGHSKGGNLAVYAAVFSPEHIRNRIVTAYSNDGPGFSGSVIDSEEYRSAADKIVTLVPQSSVIGMLLEHDGDFHVIESTIHNGLFQHDPFSWSVIGPSFIHLDSLSKNGRLHDNISRGWLAKLSSEERKKLTDTLFGVLESTGAKTVTDLTDVTFEKIAAVIRSIGNLDRETREQMGEFVLRLAQAKKELTAK